MKPSHLAFAILLAGGLTMNAGAHAVLIDGFDLGTANVSISTPSAGGGPGAGVATAVDVLGGDAIGGARDLTAWMQEQPVGGIHRASINPPDAPGQFQHDQGPGNRSHTWLQWDGIDGAANTFNAGGLPYPALGDFTSGIDTSGLGGVDLTANGETLWAVDVTSTDQVNTELLFWVWRQGEADPLANYARTRFLFDIGFTGVLTTPFTDFSFFGTADESIFSDVGAIQLHAHSLNALALHQALDLQLDRVLTTVQVPEPAALGFIALGLTGLALMRRRFRASSAAPRTRGFGAESG